MKIDVRIETLKEEIRNAKKELNEILDKAIKHSAPKGYSEGSSYEDYDCIHGTKKKVDIKSGYRKTTTRHRSFKGVYRDK